MSWQKSPAIDRRSFCAAAIGGGLGAGIGLPTRVAAAPAPAPAPATDDQPTREMAADVIVAGGGLGGCAAALAALRNGLSVILTEPTPWIGGQLTSQGVPPDEHRWIEQSGANRSYRELRTRIRDYYRRHYPLRADLRDRSNLNPGNGNVSRLCHEPRVALAALETWLAPWRSSGRLRVLTDHEPIAADVANDRVRSVMVRSLRSGRVTALQAPWFVDATELGDLLPLTGTEYVTGAEAQSDTGEMHAASQADPDNQQAFTMCFAVDHVAGEDHTIDRPREYTFWRDFVPELKPPWPGRLLDFTYTHPRSGMPKRLAFDPEGDRSMNGTLNLWTYRRMLDAAQFEPGTYAGGVSLINWPQNDYLLGNLIDVPTAEARQHIERAKQLSLSLLYWLQTEAPRPDGGTGFPGLRLRGDLMGSEDGLALAPYVRESRRIRAEFTVLEEHIGTDNRRQIVGTATEPLRAANFSDSVGVGSYAIDLHPSSAGDNYIDFTALPFQVPLGALLPVRMENLLPACKNIGTTHVTNGCYRLHPVEWGIGEAVGCLIAFAHQRRQPARAVRANTDVFAEFQKMLHQQGVETAWKLD